MTLLHRSCDRLSDQPDHALVGTVRIPEGRTGPVEAIARRVAAAILALSATALVVYLARDGYSDGSDANVSLLDSFYFAAASLSTTGYGDIVPVSDTARLIDLLIITPLRVLFLTVLVATSIQLLTERSRQALSIHRWKRRVRDHVVVVGYGTKGRAAVQALLDDGVEPTSIVVVDTDPNALEVASSLGLVTIFGDATRSDVLRLSGLSRARSVIIATGRDASALLVTLTARQLSPHAQIVATVRETDNMHLLRQSGANNMVVSDETAGRLLGLATHTPNVVDLVEDLITPHTGLAIAERPVKRTEIGSSPRDLPDNVLGVIRHGQLHQMDAPEVDPIDADDILLYLRTVSQAETDERR